MLSKGVSLMSIYRLVSKSTNVFRYRRTYLHTKIIVPPLLFSSYVENRSLVLLYLSFNQNFWKLYERRSFNRSIKRVRHCSSPSQAPSLSLHFSSIFFYHTSIQHHLWFPNAQPPSTFDTVVHHHHLQPFQVSFRTRRLSSYPAQCIMLLSILSLKKNNK